MVKIRLVPKHLVNPFSTPINALTNYVLVNSRCIMTRWLEWDDIGGGKKYFGDLKEMDDQSITHPPQRPPSQFSMFLIPIINPSCFGNW